MSIAERLGAHSPGRVHRSDAGRRGQEPAATGHKRRRHSPGQGPGRGANTTPRGPRRPDPRVRASRLKVTGLALKSQVTDEDHVLEPYKGPIFNFRSLII